MRTVISGMILLGLAACAFPGKRETYDLIDAELQKAAKPSVKPVEPDAVAAALLPPLHLDIPKAAPPAEERFSVAFNNVPASQFFMAIVSGTRYNMLVHPDVTGMISANLKDVTLFEALDAIRDLYGYDYRVEGNRIVVRPPSLQTQVFQVNYLTGQRNGTSNIRVTSTNVADIGTVNNGLNGQNGSAPNSNPNLNQNNGNQPGAQNGIARDTSKISTTSNSDFWVELRTALEAIVGSGKEGRSVVISPQSGVVVVRGMPDELRNVTAYLKATQISVGRQVILEAKILEVQLNDGFQSGVNWAAFRTGGNSAVSAGLLSPGAVLTPLPISGGRTALSSAGNVGISGTTGAALAANANAVGSLFGLAFQTSNFGALISFLESQGTVHVLSSPRIATLNNQKAVLKIGVDEFFVTNVSTTTTTGTTTTTSPSVTLQPFFSGVVLDVTPQIDERGNVILHIHPSVSQVETVNKDIDLGVGGSLRLPLASSNTSETDSVVKGRDGQIVAIGGLMRQAASDDQSQVPGAGSLPVIGTFFKNTTRVSQKRELVILLKPTVVHDETWSQDILQTEQRIQQLAPRDAWQR
ncbi:pilus (MSHA type) biogenesis protein MshL [Oxalobacteraceae bacterium OM1]|nr:pilus (MSHA type) biogenesis protein MshL [Oxalobacteraceae bacterium OM1]